MARPFNPFRGELWSWRSAPARQRVNRFLGRIRDPLARKFIYYNYRKTDITPIQVTTLSLTDPAIPAAWAQEQVLLISDVHSRGHPSERALLRFLAIQPWSLLILGGDYQAERWNDRTGFWARRFLYELRHNFPTRPVIAISGNHDSQAVLTACLRYDIDLLEDSCYLHQGCGGPELGVIGTVDPHRGQPDPQRIAAIIATHDEVPCWLVVAHAPSIIPRLAPHDRILAVLCGHTHGGQIALGRHRPLFYDPRQGRHYQSGLATWHDTLVYTTRGFGYTLAPVRLFCPPEIVRLELLHGPARTVTIKEECWLTNGDIFIELADPIMDA